MKDIIKLTVLVTLIASFNIVALNKAPVVSNVNFTQRIDSSFMVDIYFDVADYEGDIMTVTVLASNNSGATFDFAILSLTGDIGDTITNGKKKLIVWDFGNDHPNYISDQIQIKVIADDHVILGAPCPGIPTVSYEGQIYNTVQINDQCWLKENLNVGTMIVIDSASNGQTDNGIIEKYCNESDESYCDTYGGLYQWDEAMKYTTAEGTQGICPEGWHIPTFDELLELRSSVYFVKNLLLAKGQNNTDDEETNLSGFSALFAGFLNEGDVSVFGVTTFTFFFSSTEGSVDDQESGTILVRYDKSVIDIMYYAKTTARSIRCLKD